MPIKSTTTAAAVGKHPLFILYGSATGNAEHIAKQLAVVYEEQYLKKNNTVTTSNTKQFDSVICCEADQFKKKCLPIWESNQLVEAQSQQQQYDLYYGLIVIASTTGNGDAPENCSKFVRYIKHKDTIKNKPFTQHKIKYCVVGLGDTNYDLFCETGKIIDKKLNEIGGIRIQSIIMADEGTGCLEDVVVPFTNTILPIMINNCFVEKVQQDDEKEEEEEEKKNDINDEEKVEETTTESSEDKNTTNASTQTPLVDIVQSSIATSTTASTNMIMNGSNGHVLDNKSIVDGSTKSVTAASTTTTTTTTATSTSTINATTDTLPSSASSVSVSVSVSSASQTNSNSNSIGVQLVRSLLLSLQKENNDNKKVSSNASTTTTVVSKPVHFLDTDIFHDIPTTTTTFVKKCTIINNNSNHQQTNEIEKNRTTETDNDIDYDDDDDQYYNSNNPYESSIINARYLTQTKPTTTTTLNNSTDIASATSDKNIHWVNRNNVIDTMFPLTLSDVVETPSLLDEGNLVCTNNNNSSSTNEITKLGTGQHQHEERTKRVIEVQLSLPMANYNNETTKNWQYQPGDSIGIIVPNPIPVIDFVRLNVLGLNNENNNQQQQQQQQQLDESTIVQIDSDPAISINQLLTNRLDFSTHFHSIGAMKRLLYALAEVATKTEECWCLQFLAMGVSTSTNIATRFYEHIIVNQRLNFIDIIQLFPSTYTQKQISIEWLINMIPCIPPRYYSVCSSPLVQQQQQKQINDTKSNTSTTAAIPYVTIAFSAVDYITPSLYYDSITSSSTGSEDAATTTTTKNFGCRRINGLATRYLEVLALPILMKSNNDLVERDIFSGSCSTNTLERLRIFPKPTSDFVMPSSLSIPLILIGPGTGVAPFIGFLQHRQLTLQLQLQQEQPPQEQQVGSIDLYFGCRHHDHDWLYKDEMMQYEKDGILSKLHVSFSRDNTVGTYNGTVAATATTERIKYVQDSMEKTECSERLVHLIVENDAVVYVCGDGNKMAKDVQACLINILQSHFSKNVSANTDSNDVARQTAQKYLQQMKDDNRFLLDVWS